MPFTAYLPSGFQHSHENQLFDALVQRLTSRYDALPAPHVLIGNVLFEGYEMDAVFLKSDGICILEMKDHGGQIHFSENTEWFADEHQVMGGSQPNPFLQVRRNRFALRNYLRTREGQILLRRREVRWSDISAIVLFGRRIEFDDRVLGKLRLWFHITDVDHVVEVLSVVHSHRIDFSAAEIATLVKLLGLHEGHIYSGNLGASNTPLEISSPAGTGRLHLTYLKEFPFRDYVQRLRNLGGLYSQAAEMVRSLFEDVRQGIDPFVRLTRGTDDRVTGASIYQLNSVSQLLILQNGPLIFPAFVGSAREVDGWLSAHKGLVIAVDTDTGRISVTSVMPTVDISDLQPATLTAELTPLLSRLAGLNLEEMVPQKLIRKHLIELDEASTNDDVLDALEAVANEDVRRLLFDLINLVRAGDLAGAESRLRLRAGDAVPAIDAGAFPVEPAALNANSDQLLLINDLSKDELDRLLDPVNFQEWMLFLHPDQKALVEREFDRPVVLKGVSGSGKTCILVHRARALAARYPGQRIGILTLSKTLANFLQNLVMRLCPVEERRNIEIFAFYEVFRECLKHLGPEKYFDQLAQHAPESLNLVPILKQAEDRWPDRMVWDCDPISRHTVDDQWEDFYMSQNPKLKGLMLRLDKYLGTAGLDASRYLEEEFALIRSAFTVPTRRDYASFDRTGRTVAFDEELRADALQLLFCWEEWLLAGGMIDALGLTQALMPLHSEMQRLPESLRFRCLLVDEFQDFSTLDLQLLRRIVPVLEPDALILAGDTVQRILVKRLRISEAGLDTGAAIHLRITKNYRNSRQILRAASRLANHYGTVAGTQGEEIEVLDPELAQRETNAPIALKTDDDVLKAWEIALDCTMDRKAEPWTACIVTAAPSQISVDRILTARPKSLTARLLSGDCILHPEEIVVGTINDLKGFEFRLVLIVGCDSAGFPDPRSPHDEVWRDALRLYVAMTRARDQVFLLYRNQPSNFITAMGDSVVTREEPVLRRWENATLGSETPQAQANRVLKFAIGTMHTGINVDHNCAGWFNENEVDVLHRYFVRHAHRDGLTFSEWCVPRTLSFLSPSLLRNIPKAKQQTIESLLRVLKTKGVIGELFLRESGQS